MENDNILAVNIPNGISILIMAVVGGFLLAAIRKALKGNASSSNTLSAGQTGSLNTLPQLAY